jgi:hypothetical protein
MTRMICRHCGSDNVVKDAWAEWDPTADMWVLRTTFDHEVCEDCGEEGNVIIEDAALP